MTRSVRRLIMLCVVAAIAVGVAASVAGAKKPARGCTKWYTLTPVDVNDPIQVLTDKNGDEQICVGESQRGNGAQHEDNYVDNTSNSQG
jgi:hypothetical protein